MRDTKSWLSVRLRRLFIKKCVIVFIDLVNLSYQFCSFNSETTTTIMGKSLIFLVTFIYVKAIEFHKGEPYTPTTTLQELKLEGIHGTVFSDSLSNLTEITTLNILTSSIDTIEDNALCSSQFQQVRLTANFRLPNLSKQHFGKCWSLTTLQLIYNEDLQLELSVFTNLKNLINLEIIGQTIQIIRKEYFWNLTNLKNLTLVACGIETLEIESFQNLQNLISLRLENNKIKKIDGYFIQLKNLKLLNLNGNELRNFAWDDLQFWPNLEVLSLKRNKILTYDVVKLIRFCPNLQKFYIRNNIFRCKILKKLVSDLLVFNENLKIDYKMKEFAYCRQ